MKDNDILENKVLNKLFLNNNFKQHNDYKIMKINLIIEKSKQYFLNKLNEQQKIYKQEFIKIEYLKRQNIWLQTFNILNGISLKELILYNFKIEFFGEQGQDAGGLRTEFFSILLKDFVDPQKGFFQLSQNKITLQPSPSSIINPEYLLHFQFAGRILAKSILNEHVCDISLTKSLLKQIVGQDLYIADLEDIDPELTNSLLWMLNNDISDFDLGLDFTLQCSLLGQQRVIELVENGKTIDVTEQNKKEYIKSIAYYLMVQQVEQQIDALKKGFYEVIPFQYIKLLNYNELGQLIQGINKIDIQEMKQYCKYSTYNEQSEQMIWLFEILEEFDFEQRSAFLFYATGSFKVPFGGFQNFSLKFTSLTNTDLLPISHTCSRNLEIPKYESKQILKEKLLIAIYEGQQGFYIG